MKIYKKIYILNNLEYLDNGTIDLFNKFTNNKEIENELIYQNLKNYVKCSVNIDENNNYKKVEYIYKIEDYDKLSSEIINNIEKIICNKKLQNNFKELLNYIPVSNQKYVIFKEENK